MNNDRTIVELIELIADTPFAGSMRPNAVMMNVEKAK